MPWAGPATATMPAPLTGGRSRVTVSATLAANEALATRRLGGQQVLPLGFGEAGLPVHPALRAALTAATARSGYGPVAGIPALRVAAAGYWDRRELPTDPDQTAAGPGSKPLLFALLLAIGTDVAVPQPSWVSYTAHASLAGLQACLVPAAEGGVCDPAELDRAVTASAAGGRKIRSVVVTLPDNPTGRLASPAVIRELCAVADRHDLIIISDEIYRDLVHDPAAEFLSPALVAPDRTVVTTALSKNLALGGWRIGVARLPDGKLGRALRDRLLGIGSEIWSAPAVPIQHAAAVAFGEPPEISERIAQSRSLHAAVARAVASACQSAGLLVPQPEAAFYVYPDFEPWRDGLARRFGVSTGAALAGLLLDRYGASTLPASAFGARPAALQLRLATGLLYGDTDEQRQAALLAADPLTLPWIAASLSRLAEILADCA